MSGATLPEAMRGFFDAGWLYSMLECLKAYMGMGPGGFHPGKHYYRKAPAGDADFAVHPMPRRGDGEIDDHSIEDGCFECRMHRGW